jgi:hypothetical protein
LSRGIVHYPGSGRCAKSSLLGLKLVIGIAGFSIWLMGFMKRVPVSALGLMPLAIAGFAMNMTTGAVFFIGPAPNAWAMSLVGEGVLPRARRAQRDVLRDHGRRSHHEPRGGDDTPRSAKIVGAVSLVSWLGVLYWGRMLPYIGNAF